MIGEIRAAVRRLLRQRAFSATVVIILAIGFSAVLSVIVLLRATALRPIPWPAPESLVVMMMLRDRVPEPMALSLAAQWREAIATEMDVTWHSTFRADSAVADRSVEVASVGPSFFTIIGARAKYGRLFDSREQDVQDAVVLSTSGAQELFGTTDVVGRTLTVNERRVTIVGLLEQEQAFPLNAQAWIADAQSSGVRTVDLIGRLRPARSIHAIQAIAGDRLATLHSATEGEGRIGMSLYPFLDVARPTLTRRARVIVLGVAAVFVVMLVNVSALVVLRAERERFSTATRVALGASVSRLMRAAGVEIGLLVFTASVVALLLGGLFARGIINGLGGPAGQYSVLSDGPVVLSLVIVTATVAVLLAIAPLVRMRSASPLDAMRGSGGISGRRGSLVRQGVLVAQIAVTTALLSLGAAVGVAFIAVSSLDFGFSHRNLTFGTVSFESAALSTPAAARLVALQVYERVKGMLPAGDVAVWSTTYPRRHARVTEAPIAIEGQELPAQNPNLVPALVLDVSESYFSTLGIRRLEGRLFDASDRSGGDNVAIVDSLLAERLWPGQPALGQWIRVGGADSGLPWLRIVGVVADAQPVHELSLEWQSRGIRYPLLYRPFEQGAAGRLMQPLEGTGFSVAVTAEPSVSLIRALERALNEVAPNERFRFTGSLESFLDRHNRIAETRYESIVFLLFGVTGTFLALVGVIAFVEEVVAMRTREIGVRLALGAPPRAIVLLTSRQTLVAVALGCVAGAVTILLAGGTVADVLRLGEAPTPEQAAALPGVAVIAIAVVVLALAAGVTVLRAWKATDVDPSTALRIDA